MSSRYKAVAKYFDLFRMSEVYHPSLLEDLYGVDIVYEVFHSIDLPFLTFLIIYDCWLFAYWL